MGLVTTSPFSYVLNHHKEETDKTHNHYHIGDCYDLQETHISYMQTPTQIESIS